MPQNCSITKVGYRESKKVEKHCVVALKKKLVYIVYDVINVVLLFCCVSTSTRNTKTVTTNCFLNHNNNNLGNWVTFSVLSLLLNDHLIYNFLIYNFYNFFWRGTLTFIGICKWTAAAKIGYVTTDTGKKVRAIRKTKCARVFVYVRTSKVCALGKKLRERERE